MGVCAGPRCQDTLELVDRVAGLAAEQFHDVEVLAVEKVHRQVGGVAGDAERVVLGGQGDQETGRMDAGLTGEAHQAAGGGAVGLRGHDVDRVVQRRHQLLERGDPRLGHPVSLPGRAAWESRGMRYASGRFSRTPRYMPQRTIPGITNRSTDHGGRRNA